MVVELEWFAPGEDVPATAVEAVSDFREALHLAHSSTQENLNN